MQDWCCCWRTLQREGGLKYKGTTKTTPEKLTYALPGNHPKRKPVSITLSLRSKMCFWECKYDEHFEQTTHTHTPPRRCEHPPVFVSFLIAGKCNTHTHTHKHSGTCSCPKSLAPKAQSGCFHPWFRRFGKKNITPSVDIHDLSWCCSSFLGPSITSWGFQPFCNIGDLPQVGVKINKKLKPPPSINMYSHVATTFSAFNLPAT